jgi:hypothetical protein
MNVGRANADSGTAAWQKKAIGSVNRIVRFGGNINVALSQNVLKKESSMSFVNNIMNNNKTNNPNPEPRQAPALCLQHLAQNGHHARRSRHSPCGAARSSPTDDAAIADSQAS